MHQAPICHENAIFSMFACSHSDTIEHLHLVFLVFRVYCSKSKQIRAFRYEIMFSSYINKLQVGLNYLLSFRLDQDCDTKNLFVLFSRSVMMRDDFRLVALRQVSFYETFYVFFLSFRSSVRKSLTTIFAFLHEKK